MAINISSVYPLIFALFFGNLLLQVRPENVNAALAADCNPPALDETINNKPPTQVCCKAPTYRDSQAFKETKMTIFIHRIMGGRNATAVVVAGVKNNWGFKKFGSVAVADDLITQGSKVQSKEIGRAQGMYTVCSRNGAVHSKTQLSILFTNKKDRGSTLELQGVYDEGSKVSEIPVISGTGNFKLAHGSATLETVYYDRSIPYAAIKCIITLKH